MSITVRIDLGLASNLIFAIISLTPPDALLIAPQADGRGLGSGAILENARLYRQEKFVIEIKNGYVTSGSNSIVIFLCQLWLFNKPKIWRINFDEYLDCTRHNIE